MEIFCKEILSDIKMAKDEADLIRVISASLSRWRRERNSYNEAGYILNMIVSLRAMKISDLPEGTADNIKLATAIFRQLQNQRRQQIC